MHRVEVDKDKNRLYLTLGKLEGADEIAQLREKIKNACQCLKPGFNCLNDMREYELIDEKLEARVKDVLKEQVEKVEELPEKDEDDLKAVRTAIDFEAKGAAHYAKLRDSVSDPKEKAFFDLLASIEREHYLSLKDTEELLTDPSSWYERTERHALDGA